MTNVKNISQLNITSIDDRIPSSSMNVSQVQWQGWTTIGLVALMLISLVAELAPPYMIMMGILIIFIPLEILTIEEAFHGFADEAMLAVAILFIVAKGIEQSGGLEYVSSMLFSTKKDIIKPGQHITKTKNSIVWVLVKFTVPVALFSAFLANIPLVAMMIPPIVEYSKKVNMAPSKLLLPLSFAALLGGTMTLIGSSTNLVVLSMAARKVPDLKVNIFEIGVVGVPVTVAGLLYIFALSEKLLPSRLSTLITTFTAREYSIVLVIKATSSLCKKTIEQAGLNRQPGLTLLQIRRDDESYQNPSGNFQMRAKDHLQFIGVLDSILSLTQLDGLALSEDEGHEQVDLNRLNVRQCLVEAVIAAGSPMVCKRVAELQFRTHYKAAIVAIHRHAQLINCPIGKLELAAGDCLLMVADGPEFVEKHRNNSTFALVSKLPGFVPIQRQKAGIATVIVAAMVVGSALGVELITAALFACAGLLICRCLTPQDAMDALEMPVLIMISAAFGISEAMVQSGAADLVAKVLMGLAGKTVFGLITCTYIATTVFSLAITNNAAVTIMFPVALAAAQQQNLDFKPFAFTLMMASSAGFMTPTGCSTNIMVYSIGGYKFVDYLKYGGLLQIWLLIVTVGVTVTIDHWWAWWLVLIPITVGLTPLLAGLDCNMPKAKPLASSDNLNNQPALALLEIQNTMHASEKAESSNTYDRQNMANVDVSVDKNKLQVQSNLKNVDLLKPQYQRNSQTNDPHFAQLSTTNDLFPLPVNNSQVQKQKDLMSMLSTDLFRPPPDYASLAWNSPPFEALENTQIHNLELTTIPLEEDNELNFAASNFQTNVDLNKNGIFDESLLDIQTRNGSKMPFSMNLTSNESSQMENVYDGIGVHPSPCQHGIGGKQHQSYDQINISKRSSQHYQKNYGHFQ
ncbi:putative sulfur deprivation response regulator isoform X3 [Physcomitrium patens]|uniref:putative sulfur deprivation response regulator isoform X3 n=1 Tax=Physcomitrium patens TaxID=3218 RepID=UPI000D15C214|nr:putative sulfur deprivation response regulator isoform X3 [Physcomitrium patens]|eukprot:XP_024377736.1 putative sulfur deprivation response regulator isoform X3 [Physcomitrella patens]